VVALNVTADHSEQAEPLDLIATMRRVAEAVIHGEPHARVFTIEVKGRLAELTGSTLFPSRTPGGGSMVAREGLEPPTPGL
jgi:site-specific DNA recombinase